MSSPRPSTHEDAEKASSDHVQAVIDAEVNNVAVPLPTGWMYKRPKFGHLELPHYASPILQLLLVSITFFLCPGMYNALNGLGGAGQLGAKLNDNATVALYSAFAFFAFFSGAICNRLGVKITLFLGGIGYSLYVGSFICYNRTQNEVFVIVSGALLGVSASLLYNAQGVVLMSYPNEAQKGKYIAIFWMIFNLGAVIGSLVPLIETIHSQGTSVGIATYIAFFILEFIGAITALALSNARHVRRNDGSTPITETKATWKRELVELFRTLRTDTYIIGLFPMFFASNWFYTYQFNDVNLARFNIRTRSLNSLLYWTFQIVGAGIFGYLLDLTRFTRRTRALAGLFLLFLVTMGIWGGGLAFQLPYTRESVIADPSYLDWTSSNYGGPLVLYICYGFFDALWQTYVYWVMGALSNSGTKLAFFAGFFKAMQASGAAIVFRLDALELSYMKMFAITWGLLGGSLLVAFPVIWFRVQNHSEDREFPGKVAPKEV